MPVQDSFPALNKPEHSGFWAAPIINGFDPWRDFCENEDFNTERLNKHFDFSLKLDTKVLMIEDETDLQALMNERPDFFFKAYCLKYEKIAEEYDAVEIHAGRYDLHDYFNTWDVDSICIFRPECIKI